MTAKNREAKMKRKNNQRVKTEEKRKFLVYLCKYLEHVVVSVWRHRNH